MKVAIIGSGISGNTVAWKLKDKYDVTLYEASDHLGGHTHTHDIAINDKQYAIDTGFIVFNEKTYPNFIAMLESLNIDYQPTEMSFSVKDTMDSLEYNGHNLNTLFSQRRNITRPAFIKMIRDILRFNREAPQSLHSLAAFESLGNYLALQGYGKFFINKYILPMGAAIWSTDTQKMLDFPAHFFIRFFINHGLLQTKNRPQWFTVKGGSKTYVEKMLSGLKQKTHTQTPIESIRRINNKVEVKPRGKPVKTYDAVFIATHSDQALKMRGNDTSQLEKHLLGNIKYQQNTAVLHTDNSLLPQRQRAWASWNYHIDDQKDAPVALTYHMNRLQSIEAPVDFCVTLNNHRNINPKKIIKTIDYHHPVFTADSIAAQQHHKRINNFGIYYCGAYWGNGFHEDGMVSALNAIEHFEERHHAKLYL